MISSRYATITTVCLSSTSQPSGELAYNKVLKNCNIFVFIVHVAYFLAHTIQYDIVYLMCSKKLTCSQLSPPHGTDKKLKKKRSKNKSRSMISPVWSCDREDSPVYFAHQNFFVSGNILTKHFSQCPASSTQILDNHLMRSFFSVVNPTASPKLLPTSSQQCWQQLIIDIQITFRYLESTFHRLHCLKFSFKLIKFSIIKARKYKGPLIQTTHTIPHLKKDIQK